MGHFACLFLLFNSPDRPRRRELVQVSLGVVFVFFFRVNIFFCCVHSFGVLVAVYSC